MTHRTKIIVLRKKELLLFSIIAVLSFLLLAFFIYFLRNQKEISTELPSTSTYAPGVYTASVVLNDTAMNVSVSLDQNNINSISLVHLDESAKTMYPLIRPALEDLSQQIIASQSVEDVTYPQSNPYTSILLHNAIREAVKKGSL